MEQGRKTGTISIEIIPEDRFKDQEAAAFNQRLNYNSDCQANGKVTRFRHGCSSITSLEQ